jgi:hypothetical protein
MYSNFMPGAITFSRATLMLRSPGSIFSEMKDSPAISKLLRWPQHSSQTALKNRSKSSKVALAEISICSQYMGW